MKGPPDAEDIEEIIEKWKNNKALELTGYLLSCLKMISNYVAKELLDLVA